MKEQEAQYKLSDDIAQAVPSVKSTEELPLTIWAQLTCKYLHDPRRRATLGALGILAGYRV